MKRISLLLLGLLLCSVQKSYADALVPSLLSQAEKISKDVSPYIIRDMVQGQWMFGGMYSVYRNPDVGTILQSKLNLPALPMALPIEIAGGVVAPLNTMQGTPMVSALLDVTPTGKKALLMALDRLPSRLENQLGFLEHMLQNDADSTGIVAIGGSGGRDFNRGLWRGGVAFKVTLQFSNLFKAANGEKVATQATTPAAPEASSTPNNQ